MPKTLIIAEKPSVATDLARVLGKIPELGKFQKKKEVLEESHYFSNLRNEPKLDVATERKQN